MRSHTCRVIGAIAGACGRDNRGVRTVQLGPGEGVTPTSGDTSTLISVRCLHNVPAAVEALAALANASTPRVGCDTTSLHDALYMSPGRGGLAIAPIDEEGAIWRYTPRHSHWDQIKPADSSAPYPVGRSYHAIVSRRGCCNCGGPAEDNSRLEDAWRLQFV